MSCYKTHIRLLHHHSVAAVRLLSVILLRCSVSHHHSILLHHHHSMLMSLLLLLDLHPQVRLSLLLFVRHFLLPLLIHQSEQNVRMIPDLRASREGHQWVEHGVIIFLELLSGVQNEIPVELSLNLTLSKQYDVFFALG